MPFVYVVMGQTGDYSDRTEWPVCAYSDIDKAHTHVQLAQARANELALWRSPNNEEWRYVDRGVRPGNEYDPNMQMDYSETRYFVYETELLDTIPGVVIEAPLPEPDRSPARPYWERLEEEDE